MRSGFSGSPNNLINCLHQSSGNWRKMLKMLPTLDSRWKSVKIASINLFIPLIRYLLKNWELRVHSEVNLCFFQVLFTQIERFSVF